MKWLAKHTKTDYSNGATRLKRFFSWLPIYISGKMIWLEMYEVLQVYEIKTYAVIIEDKEVVFKVSNWVNLSKRIIEWQ